MAPPLLPRRPRHLTLSLLLWIFAMFILYRVFLSDGPAIPLSGLSSIAGPGPNGERYAPIYHNKLPKGSSRQLPRLQVSPPPEGTAVRAERERRRDVVKARFEQTWRSYRERAFGADELTPISGKANNVASFGAWGATLVDSLDSLWIFGMKEDFEACLPAVEAIAFNHTTSRGEINVFETAIRYMGGLLGAYDISGQQYPVLLAKAVEIGDWIYAAFDTPNRMPVTRWRPDVAAAAAIGQSTQYASQWSLLAELGSFTLEFTRLSQLTGNGKYYDAVYRVARAMDENQQRTRIPGLWPIIIDANSLIFDNNVFSLGGMADSAYEYLPKSTALVGGGEPMYQRMYERAIAAARKHLFFRPLVPDEADILVSGSAQVQDSSSRADGKSSSSGGSGDGGIERENQGQHLTCFVGGMVLMGAKLYGRDDDEFRVGRKLTEGCVWAYDSMPSGIMPEVFHMAACENANDCQWSEERWSAAVVDRQSIRELKGVLKEDAFAAEVMTKKKLVPGYTAYEDKRYGLRPEAIESVWYAWRMTADARYQEDAWRMWQAIDRHTRTDLAHAELTDVTVDRPPKRDRMESFWLAETLKYFFLIFSDHELLSLDRYVLNTEAHPFLRPGAVWQEDIRT